MGILRRTPSIFAYSIYRNPASKHFYCGKTMHQITECSKTLDLYGIKYGIKYFKDQDYYAIFNKV
jgi:hypothetical protein